MNRCVLPVTLLFLAACTSTSVSPTSNVPVEPAASAAPAPAPTAEPAAAPEPAGPKPPADMAAWCQKQCTRNGVSCESIDVAGCSDNCTEAFGSVRDFCPIRLTNFTQCVEESELRCKAGAKIRPTGCDDSSAQMAFCLMTFAQDPASRCKGPHCEEYGQCELIDGVCTATPESCEKLEMCSGGKCKVANNMCSL